MSNFTKKIFVAMSGGVDSSVAAALLKECGYNVIGVHMICWGGCENNENKRDAMRVAAVLDIPFLIWDFREEYKRDVYDYMIREYVAGQTPNPDVMCNKQIKFGAFLNKALENGADFIATGHYVSTKQHILSQTDNSSRPAQDDYLHSRPENFRFAKDQVFRDCESSSKVHVVSLHIAKDQNKDQSYFLWTLIQDQLKYCFFPIGDYLKSEVRKLAKKFNLPISEKKDSQGLCFVGKIDFLDFLKEKIPIHTGNILNLSGTKIGTHEGAHFYTIGQRHGLFVGGRENPMYVADKNIFTNTVTVAESKNSALYKKEIGIKKLNWILGVEPNLPLRCLARIRHRQSLQKAMLYASRITFRVNFDVPQRAVASGQSIVFYSKDGEVLGGSVIV